MDQSQVQQDHPVVSPVNYMPQHMIQELNQRQDGSTPPTNWISQHVAEALGFIKSENQVEETSHNDEMNRTAEEQKIQILAAENDQIEELNRNITTFVDSVNDQTTERNESKKEIENIVKTQATEENENENQNLDAINDQATKNETYSGNAINDLISPTNAEKKQNQNVDAVNDQTMKANENKKNNSESRTRTLTREYPSTYTLFNQKRKKKKQSSSNDCDDEIKSWSTRKIVYVILIILGILGGIGFGIQQMYKNLGPGSIQNKTSERPPEVVLNDITSKRQSTIVSNDLGPENNQIKEVKSQKNLNTDITVKQHQKLTLEKENKAKNKDVEELLNNQTKKKNSALKVSKKSANGKDFKTSSSNKIIINQSQESNVNKFINNKLPSSNENIDTTEKKYYVLNLDFLRDDDFDKVPNKRLSPAFVPDEQGDGYCPVNTTLYCTHPEFFSRPDLALIPPFCINNENLYNELINKNEIFVTIPHENLHADLAYTKKMPYRCRIATNTIPNLNHTGEFPKVALVMITMLEYKMKNKVHSKLTAIDQKKPYCSVKIANNREEYFFNVEQSFAENILEKTDFKINFTIDYDREYSFEFKYDSKDIHTPEKNNIASKIEYDNDKIAVSTAKNKFITEAFFPDAQKNGYCPADATFYCSNPDDPFCTNDEDLAFNINLSDTYFIKPFECIKAANTIHNLDHTEFVKVVRVMKNLTNMLQNKYGNRVYSKFIDINQKKPYCSVKIDKKENFFNVDTTIAEITLEKSNFEVYFEIDKKYSIKCTYVKTKTKTKYAEQIFSEISHDAFVQINDNEKKKFIDYVYTLLNSNKKIDSNDKDDKLIDLNEKQKELVETTGKNYILFNPEFNNDEETFEKMIFTAKNFTLAFVPGTSKNGYCPADKNIYCTHANFSMENFQWGPFCISDENLYNKSNKKKIPVIFNHKKFLAYHSTTEKPYKCRKTTNIIPNLDQTKFTKAAIVMINMLRYKIEPGVRPNLKVGRIAEFTEIDQNKPYCSVKIDNTEDFFNVLGGIMTQFNFEVAFKIDQQHNYSIKCKNPNALEDVESDEEDNTFIKEEPSPCSKEDNCDKCSHFIDTYGSSVPSSVPLPVENKCEWITGIKQPTCQINIDDSFQNCGYEESKTAIIPEPNHFRYNYLVYAEDYDFYCDFSLLPDEEAFEHDVDVQCKIKNEPVNMKIKKIKITWECYTNDVHQYNFNFRDTKNGKFIDLTGILYVNKELKDLEKTIFYKENFPAAWKSTLKEPKHQSRYESSGQPNTKLQTEFGFWMKGTLNGEYSDRRFILQRI